MISIESLPYFGKINSISRIVKIENEVDKHYLVKRYDAYGNEKKESFVVPINLNNTRGLLEDYCKDLKDYLTKNESKYIQLKNKKKMFNKSVSLEKLNLFDKISKFGICLGIMFVGLTFSVVSVPVIFWSGMCLLVISGVGILAVNDVNKELDDNKFVSDYDDYSKRLNEFRSCLDNKFKNSVTKYNGLGQEKNKGNSLRLKKVKTLN